MARAGYDALTIDMQHGFASSGDLLPMLQAINAVPEVAPIVRVPGHDPALIMRALDLGAFGIICPLVNNADEAARFVGACRYPPSGYRSYGPTRARPLLGADYLNEANGFVVALAMIETREGLDNLDAIIATPGLDGVFIGPNDLAIALGERPGYEVPTQPVMEAIRMIHARAKVADRMTSIFTGSVAFAREMIALGVDLVVCGTDSSLMSSAAVNLIGQIRAT